MTHATIDRTLEPAEVTLTYVVQDEQCRRNVQTSLSVQAFGINDARGKAKAAVRQEAGAAFVGVLRYDDVTAETFWTGRW
jgi:hypothetical protein